MTAPTAAFPSGTPLAPPFYVVDQNGNPITSSNPQNVTETNSASILSGIGAQADNVWPGSGSGSEIAILKKVAANQAGPYNVQFQTPQSVNSGYTELTGSANALNGYLLNWTDISSYAWFSVYIYGTYSGTVSFLQSPDNGVHTGAQLLYLGQSSLNPNQEASTTTGTSQLWVGPRLSRYLAVQMTSFSSGTANVIVGLFTIPPALILNGTNAVQSGTWTVQPGNTPNTTPWLVTEANNNASVPAGAGNTVIKNAAGQLSTMVVTTAGTGAGNVQIFDNASTNSGLVLHAFPATVSVAQAYQIHGWAKNGMTAQNVANGPVFTVYYS